MSDNITRENILQSEFCINCRDLNKSYNKCALWEKKNAVREIIQKFYCRSPLVKKIKNKCRVKKTNQWICPCCHKTVRRLTCAHVGERACDILDNILKEHPEKNIHDLINIYRTRHENKQLVICCDTCNKGFEN